MIEDEGGALSSSLLLGASVELGMIEDEGETLGSLLGAFEGKLLGTLPAIIVGALLKIEIGILEDVGGALGPSLLLGAFVELGMLEDGGETLGLSLGTFEGKTLGALLGIPSGA